MEKDLSKKIKESLEKTKKAIEKPVEIVGLDKKQQHFVNQILQHIDSTTISKLQTDLNMLEEQKKHLLNYLVPIKMAINLIKDKHSKTKVYLDLEKSIKSFDKDLETLDKQIERYNGYIAFTKENVDKIHSHIDIETLEDKAIWTYDTPYFEALIDLAVLTIPLDDFVENDEKQEVEK